MISNATNAQTGTRRPLLDYAKPETLGSSDDYTLAAIGDVFVVIWHKDTTPAGVAALEQRFAAFCESNGGGVCLLTVVESQAAMPSNEARNALALFMKSNGSSIRLSGVAFEGEGLRAAAVRSVVTGLTLLARQPFPHKVFATVAETLDWMFQMRGESKTSPRAPQVAASINIVRSARAERRSS